MISTLQLELFGGLRVWADGALLLEAEGPPADAWRLLCCLVLHRGAPVPRQCLLATLWPKHGQLPPGKVEQTAAALCQKLGAAEGETPVFCTEKGWKLDDAIELVVDAFLLEKTCHILGEAVGLEKRSHVAHITELYKGPLLPGLASESWVVPHAGHFCHIFVACVGSFCAFLQQEEQYNELLQIATEASLAEPLEEELTVYIFRALSALRMYKAIVPAYHRLARALSMELGAMPCQEIQDIYVEAAALVDATSQDVMVIRQDLETVAEQYAANGPLLCSYDVFQYLYRMVARTSERTGLKIAILLLSLNGAAGGQFPTARVVSQGMHRLQGHLMALLRKSDIVARYTRSQFLLLLSVDKPASLQLVQQRIANAAGPALEALELELALTEIEPV